MARSGAARRGVAIVALAVFVAVLAGCSGESGQATLGKRVDASTTTAAPTTTTPSWQSYAARANGATIKIYDAPSDAQPKMELPNPWVYDPDYPDQTIPQVFLVEKLQGDWTQVLLPVRPNGSTGWVRTADVTISPNPFHVRVELAAHKITVTKEDQTIYTGTVAIGKPSTPTPTGNYYLRILIKTIDPSSVYGPYAYGLSSHSEALDTFAGGDAEIGIHGNNDASVLGSDVTSGCVRMDNDAITNLTKQLPLGTPVDIS